MPASNVKLIKGSDLRQWQADKERQQTAHDDREEDNLIGHLMGVISIVTKHRPRVRDKIISRLNNRNETA